MVYKPSEDSYFLAKIAKEHISNKNIEVLDLGTGSAIQADQLEEQGIDKNNILTVDIDKKAVNNAETKGFKSKQSDLFKNINKKFDLIVFNPPYLPESEHDKEKDTTGGKRGDETILRFLKQVKNYIKDDGFILLLLSNLTPRERIEKELEKQKLIKDKVAEKHLFFEILEVWKITIS